MNTHPPWVSELVISKHTEQSGKGDIEEVPNAPASRAETVCVVNTFPRQSSDFRTTLTIKKKCRGIVILFSLRVSFLSLALDQRKKSCRQFKMSEPPQWKGGRKRNLLRVSNWSLVHSTDLESGETEAAYMR